MTTLRIGTRGSALARWQADTVANQLADDVVTSTIVIDSQGDRDLSSPLWRINGIGVFTAALDEALLRHEVDVAVHSMKDVPTTIPDGLRILAVLPRGSSSDVAVMTASASTSDALERQLTIGTSSRRRSAQWLHRFPHHRTVALRGNIATRLAQIQSGKMDGIIMAEAALLRLQIMPTTLHRLEWMTPAPSQGAICVIGRDGDEHLSEILRPLHDPKTALATRLERGFLAALDGGCSSAIGAIAEVGDSGIEMRCSVHRSDGTQGMLLTGRDTITRADELLQSLVDQALHAGAQRMIAEARGE